MADPGIRGRFVWYDLMTTDTAAAQRFYTGVLGWGLETWMASGTPYVMWKRHDTAIGGSMALPAGAMAGGARPHWIAYIATPDVDDTVVRAKKLGASVLAGPMDIPTVGRFASLADPQGAIFAAFTPSPSANPPKRGDEPLVGDFSWHELSTTDSKAAFKFYGALFGWVKDQAMDMGPELGIYQMYKRPGGQMMGGMFDKAKEMPGPMWWLYVRVADINKGLDRVKKFGGVVYKGPTEVPGGDLIAQCADPQGAMFALHERKSVAKAKPPVRAKAPAKRRAAAKPTGKKRTGRATGRKSPSKPRRKAAGRAASRKKNRRR